jgi:hypothetical protein
MKLYLTSLITENKKKLKMIFEIASIFIMPILSIIGFIFNLLSIIVFSLIIKNDHRDDMYKYLLLKSICEALGCFFSTFSPMYYYNGSLKNTFIMVNWFIWFQMYIIKALFMSSSGFEIAATFNCCILIEKQLKWCEKRVSFCLWILFILILSFGVEIIPTFMITINEYTFIDQFNRTIHRYNVSGNHFVLKYFLFGLVDSIIKEVLFLLILLSLNIYILYKLIQIGRRKKRLATNSSNIQNNRRAEKRKAMMIIVLFLTFIMGHLPNFLFFAFNKYFGSEKFWTGSITYGLIFLYFSYSISFFVYFAFNNVFRHLFLKFILFRPN